VVCFDLDGTLIPGTTSSHHLATVLGHAEELGSYEEAYAAGRVTNQEVSEFDARWYQGLPLEDMHRHLERVPVLDGIKETVAQLRAMGYRVVLGTIAWQFIAEWFRSRYGFDDECGTGLEVDGTGRFSGLVSAHFDELDKVAFVRAVAAEHGVAMGRCVAVGDGHSDVPLFRAVGASIALNATAEAREAATCCLTTADLRDVLPLIAALPHQRRSHFQGSPGPEDSA
jgi:phosphoserine phosphatase